MPPWLEGSLMNGVFDASSLHSGTDGGEILKLLVRTATFKQDVKLSAAKIMGPLDMSEASFERKLNADP